MTRAKPELSELLIELAATTDMSPTVIKDAIAAHAEHREEILRFALEWHAGRDDDSGSDVPPLLKPDLSTFGMRTVADPFEGKTYPELHEAAAVCDIPLSILMKLEQRSIDVNTVPLRLLRRLAACLGTGLDSLIAFLSLAPTLSTQASYRSDKPPAVSNQVSFASVVVSTPMDEAQRARWRALTE